MLSKLRARAGDESGFTLIELLVVILIIGILAAVAIPSFLNQKSKANDAAAKSDAKTAQTAMETFFTDSQNYNADATALTGIESALKNANGLDSAGDGDSYVVSTKSASNPAMYFAIIRAADGTVTRKCGTDAPTVTANGVTAGLLAGGGTGGCKTGNIW